MPNSKAGAVYAEGVLEGQEDVQSQDAQTGRVVSREVNGYGRCSISES